MPATLPSSAQLLFSPPPRRTIALLRFQVEWAYRFQRHNGIEMSSMGNLQGQLLFDPAEVHHVSAIPQ